MTTTGALGGTTRLGMTVLLTVTLLATLVGATPRQARAQEEAGQQTGRLWVTIADETGLARGGACVLVVDAAGTEQVVCDDDGDGTLLAEGLAPGAAAVKPVQASAGCAGAFGGEVEVPAGGEAALTLTDACEPLAPVEEPLAPEPPVEEPQPTEEPKPTEAPKATEEPTVEPSETPVDTPTEAPTEAPQPTVVTAPTPTPTPLPTTGTLLIALTSGSFGTPSLGACYEILNLSTFATLAGCDGDDGATDGLTAFTNVPRGSVGVQQMAGDPDDNLAASRNTRIAGGKTTSIALVTMLLSTLEVVPVDENGQTWTSGPCFELRRSAGVGSTPGACIGSDGIARFTNLPSAAWSLVETVAPIGYGLAEDRVVTLYPDQDQTVTVPHEALRGSLRFQLVGYDHGATVFGGCVEVDTQGVHCDSDKDGVVVLDDLPLGSYSFKSVGYGETLNRIGYGGADTYQEATIEAGALDQTVQLGFLRINSEVAVFTVDEQTNLAVPGGCYTIYEEDANGVRAALDVQCDAAGDVPGEVTLEVYRPGRYVVAQTSTPPGYLPKAEQQVDIAVVPDTYEQWAGEPHPIIPARGQVTFRLAANTGNLRVLMRDSNGQQLRNGCIVLDPQSARPTGRCGVDAGATDSHLIFTGLPTGLHQISFAWRSDRAGNYPIPLGWVMIQAGQTSVWTATAPPSNELWVDVVWKDAGGMIRRFGAIACFQIFTSVNGQPGTHVRTVCAGDLRFGILLLPAGQYVLRQISFTALAAYATNPSPWGISWIPDTVFTIAANAPATEVVADLSTGASSVGWLTCNRPDFWLCFLFGN